MKKALSLVLTICLLASLFVGFGGTGAFAEGEVTYSLNKTIATVDENGTVTGVNPGELWLTAQLTQEETKLFEEGKTAQIQIRCFGATYDAPGSAVFSVDVWPALDDRILGGESDG